MTEIWTREPVEDSQTSTGYPVTEQTTGINFRAYSATFSRNYTSLRSYRSALSYVTGSHAFKVGMTLQEGPAVTDVYTNLDTGLIVRNGAPFQVTVRTTPYTARERLVADLGIYAQDTWTINRLTANLGVRWDYLNNKVEAQSASGGRWIGPRSFDELTNVPNYKDIAPRLGRRLRPVRQRQDGAEGDVQPLRADLDGEHRAAAEPLQHDGQQHDPALGRCQPRRHSAGRRSSGRWPTPTSAGSASPRSTTRTPSRGSASGAANWEVLGERDAGADVARVGGRRLLPPLAGSTSRPPTTSTSRRPTSSRTA